ncbi:MAG: 16S rRNA (adenine(1518)-N(6)/adenine(1519)-N(6))-dimethyltransferase RsmA [Gammaproteobacteria bacterium]|nr:16S rRNA (adenine(1518)-N(6)/adenine(1519)-N(6))-dimethyltransferase RsmA [Gammaproteobacteria bacterium]
MPRKRFGQHFLVDQKVIADIHRVVAIRTSDVVLEIGPGRGALTAGLVDSAAQVIAVEIDRDLAADLKVRFPSACLIEDDVLSVSGDLFRKKRIVGNLPYNISTNLLLRLASQNDFVDMHLMLQREVVERITAVPCSKSWGRLSVKVQRIWETHRHFDVAPEAFVPQPQVTSTFVRIVPLGNPVEIRNESVFDNVLRTAFSQRRKKLSNSLSQFEINWSRLGIDSAKRADQLGVMEYATIANSLVR